MTKWEYLTIELTQVKNGEGFIAVKEWKATAITEQLNKYGQDGWELVDIVAPDNMSSYGKTFATFKRSIRE